MTSTTSVRDLIQSLHGVNIKLSAGGQIVVGMLVKP